MELTQQKKTLTTEQLLDQLKGENWNKIIKQLHYYSLNRIKKFPQLSERFNIINLANHFADEAIRQVWMQERIWDINHYPDVYSFLKAAVDSIRSNFLKSKDTINTTFINEIVEETMQDRTNIPDVQVEIKELEEIVRMIFSDDGEAYQVFDCIKNNMQPRHISKELDIPINQVYNAIKRIDRKLTEIRKKLKN